MPVDALSQPQKDHPTPELSLPIIMAYPVYDSYNSQVGFPARSRSVSFASPYTPSYYDRPMSPGGMYGDKYPQTAYSMPYSGAMARSASRYSPVGVHDDREYGDYFDGGYAASYSPPGMMARRPSMSRHGGRMSMDSYHGRHSSSMIKFKRKGGMHSGITLGEAMANVPLSGNDSLTHYDLNADSRGRIILRLRWTGYSSMTYELPVDDYDGYVELQTLARRIARACVHYLQSNMIPVPWDQVMLFHMEEVAYGTWQPVLSTA